MKKTVTNFQKAPLPFLIIIVILSVILFGFLCTFINRLFEDRALYKPSRMDANTYYYYVEGNDYYYIYTRSLSEKVCYPDKTPAAEDAVALGDYFMDQLRYTALKDSDPDLAEIFKDKMDENKDKTGDFSYKTAEVDALFEKFQ